MSKIKITLALLACALIGSNAWWAYRALDHAVSYGYLSDSYHAAVEQRDVAFSLLRLIGAGHTSRVELLDAAKAIANSDPFEKDGYVWVGFVGLQFDAGGRLKDIQGN